MWPTSGLRGTLYPLHKAPSDISRFGVECDFVHVRGGSGEEKYCAAAAHLVDEEGGETVGDTRPHLLALYARVVDRARRGEAVDGALLAVLVLQHVVLKDGLERRLDTVLRKDLKAFDSRSAL